MALPFWTVLTFLSRHPIVLHLRQKTASRTRRHNFSICSGTAPRFYLTWPCVARNCWGSSGSVGGGDGVEGGRENGREREREATWGGIDYRWGKAVEEKKKKKERGREREVSSSARDLSHERTGSPVQPLSCHNFSTTNPYRCTRRNPKIPFLRLILFLYRTLDDSVRVAGARYGV